jgi:two-component system, NarL family, sensor kinase
MLGKHIHSSAKGVVVLPAQNEEAIWHIAQEDINNCQKHSGQHEIFFDFTFRANLALMTIKDNGCGFCLWSETRIPFS